MNKVIFLIIIFSYGLNIGNSNAASVGSQFNYQGELIDNGSPANGDYDITIEIFSEEVGGSPINGITTDDVTVVNGLFSIEEIDFGDAVYADSGQFFLEVSLQPSSGGTTEILTPRQRLNAVPYAVQAEYLAPGSASNGDVLQFDGSDWVASASSSLSPWTISGSNISYTAGRVHIGSTSGTPATLHVNAATGDSFRVQNNQATKLMVHENGGVSVGSSGDTPEDGLTIVGDAQQSSQSAGLVKYLVNASCSNISPSLIRSHNGTLTPGNITIDPGASTGKCTLNFPTEVVNRYLISSVRFASANRAVTCAASGSNKISCTVYIPSTGVEVNDTFYLVIY